MAGVTVTGIDELITKLNRLSNDVANNPSLNREIGQTLAQKASAIAPRLTGALASSIKGEGSATAASVIAGSSSVPYAGVIEYGWPQKGREAKPYLQPAVNNNMNYVIEKYENSINSAIKKYNLQ